MSERKPWVPDGSRLVQAMELIAQPAVDAGMTCFGQFFLFGTCAIEGGEVGMCGPLRYTSERVLKDSRALPDGATAAVCFIVRFCDPETPEGAAEKAFHEKARELERKGLEGKR